MKKAFNQYRNSGTCDCGHTSINTVTEAETYKTFLFCPTPSEIFLFIIQSGICFITLRRVQWGMKMLLPEVADEERFSGEYSNALGVESFNRVLNQSRAVCGQAFLRSKRTETSSTSLLFLP